VPHTIGVARIGNPVCAVVGPHVLLALPVGGMTELFGAPMMGRGSSSAGGDCSSDGLAHFCAVRGSESLSRASTWSTSLLGDRRPGLCAA
jgi:hypothetical protein